MILEKIYRIYLDSKKVCIDTRKLEKGDIFFCLRGENNDGNEFAQEAIKKGAKLVVSDNENYKTMSIDWNNDKSWTHTFEPKKME